METTPSNINMTVEPCLANGGEDSKNHGLYTLFLIMALAVGLRLVQWNLIDSLYRDTVNFIALSERFSTESLRHPIQEPIHPLLLRGIHTVLFPREVPTPAINVASWELTVFADGIFFTLICLWLLYAIGRCLHSSGAGLWAAFFLAIMPYGVEYSINGLSELPYTTLLLMSVYLVIRSQEKNCGLLILAAGICAALLMLTRKEGFILIPIVLGYLLLRRNARFGGKIKASTFFLMGAGILFLVYYRIGGRFYWFSEYLQFLGKLTNRIFSDQTCIGGKQSILALSWINKKYEFLTLPIGGWFKLSGFVPAILFLVYLVKRRNLKINTGVGLLILYASIHFTMVTFQTIVGKFFVTRYLFPVCVILFPVAGLTMVEILGKINLKYGKPANHSRIGLITAMILAVVFTGEIFQNGFTSRHTEVLAASLWLKENTPENTLIFVSDDRVGFYSRRSWENVKIYHLSSTIQALPTNNRVNYLAISHKIDQKDYIQSYVNEFSQHRNIQTEVVQIFSNRKNAVTIYRLGVITVPATTTAPVER